MSKKREGATPDSATPEPFVFRLYVTGVTPRSTRAVVNSRGFCERHLKGRYLLEILDIADNVAMATSDQIVGAPTLVKLAPAPVRRFIGDMSNADRLLRGLDLAGGT